MSTTVAARRSGAVSSNGNRAVDDPGTAPGWSTAASGPLSAIDAADVDTVLAAVQHHALALYANAVRPPSHLRVTAGDIVVELAWTDLAELGDDRREPVQATAPPRRHPVPAPRSVPGGAVSGGAVSGGAVSGGAVSGGAVSGGAVPGEAAPVEERPADSSTAGGDAGLSYVTAPSVGVFYYAPEPGARPFVRVGDTVKAGQQVAILEVMKLMIPIEADTAGRIVEVCQPDATSVEYGERLIAIDPDARG
ncbi:biotin carboxyl carrier protein [Frankia casuarinae]|jgi:acetyl-CoA carboxylase biotin carboxyl carrier protein|uniref:Biotin carboxyl carrier protein of acetyl-CoA carboxylase n=1 Tax=Frankia casuarinae (strain DSM 45818 / CECT 9043 / HFP020203 / CcI3) TaxID=106370 RepID=Q2J8V7_FRACC|nr:MULTISPECIES: acetyl-CoA carboxylase biotin carboxyl carrier protein subunit [Frankia]ABD12285.1 biotin/lipoyl attachment [Frankia casuarinae]EYT89999.1 biotin carboxyl carrier protein [Frankia casuarinae]KFB03179.1 biotin carboxyl carrier protein [Frankia sp. Allo2]OAA20779.1 acetyl-CoA carboxylase biotin carboxyl carrier protein [Frankia casuarinae]